MIETLAAKPRVRALPLALLCFAVFLLSVYDVYFPGIGLPIIPVFGTLALIVAIPLIPQERRFQNVRKHVQTILLSIVLVLLFFASTAWGLVYSGSVFLKASIGMAMGLVILNMLAIREESDGFKEYLYRCLNIILIIHVSCWVIQFVYFFTSSGTYLDFIEPITGMPTRHKHELVNIALTVTRFTGLFAEPAIYSTFVFMGLTVRMIHNEYRMRAFDWIIGITILCSLSIYGYFLFFTVLAVGVVKTGRGARSLGISLLVILVAALFIIFSDSPVATFLQVRMAAPLSDASGNARLSNPFVYYSELPDAAQAFGIGLGNYGEDFEEGNGVATLLVFLGAVGLAICGSIFVGLLIMRGFPAVAWVFLAVSLLGAPLFTNEYWWLWIGMLLLYSRRSLYSEVT